MVGNKTKVLLQDMDLIRFRQELEAAIVFKPTSKTAQSVNVGRDAKLELLKKTIASKVANP
ncbi:hypothetical protein ACVXHB_20225 [Escherichia coli]